jgi:hypothetical protein
VIFFCFTQQGDFGVVTALPSTVFISLSCHEFGVKISAELYTEQMAI